MTAQRRQIGARRRAAHTGAARLAVSAACALALHRAEANQPIPDKFLLNTELRKVKWIGELANPFAEFQEARFEQKLSSLPHERMQFYGGDSDDPDPHVEAQYRSVPKYLLDDASMEKGAEEVARLRAAIAKAEGETGFVTPDAPAADETTDAPSKAPTLAPTWKPGVHSPCTHKTNDGDPCNTLPTEFSWFAFHGKGLLTRNLNQHIPKYCGACWLFSGASMLADRIKIARAANVAGLGPDVEMAQQTILNCAKRIAGTCANGTIHGVFSYINDASGIPYSTCQNYEATDLEQCSPRSYCLGCASGNGECYGVPAVPSWDPSGYGMWTNGIPKIYLREWGYIGKLFDNSVRDLQIEIITRGPIACAVYPVALQVYKKGIVDRPWNGELGHMLELVGWGQDDDGTKFWHVRNSWGEYWGERGFARVKRGVNALGIESACTWVVPGSWGTFETSYGNNIDAAKANSSHRMTDADDWAKTADDQSHDDDAGPGGADDADDDHFEDDGNKSSSSVSKSSKGASTPGAGEDNQYVKGGGDGARGKSAKGVDLDADDHADNLPSAIPDAFLVEEAAFEAREATRKDGGLYEHEFWEQDLVESLWMRSLPTDYTHPAAREAGFSGADEAARKAALDQAMAYPSDDAAAPEGGPAAHAVSDAVDASPGASTARDALDGLAMLEGAAAQLEATARANSQEGTSAADAAASAAGGPLVLFAAAVVGAAALFAGFAGGRRFERRAGYDALTLPRDETAAAKAAPLPVA